MTWTHRQFGELEYEPRHVLEFVEGLIGFEDCRKFILINEEQSKPLVWLVSLEDAELSFPLLDPKLIAPEFDAERQVGGGKTVLAVVTLRPSLTDSTINLRSPIVLENATQSGRQVVLDNERYPFQHPLFVAAEEPVKG
jgi:flagellar assembly factor FliW